MNHVNLTSLIIENNLNNVSNIILSNCTVNNLINNLNYSGVVYPGIFSNWNLTNVIFSNDDGNVSFVLNRDGVLSGCVFDNVTGHV